MYGVLLSHGDTVLCLGQVRRERVPGDGTGALYAVVERRISSIAQDIQWGEPELQFDALFYLLAFVVSLLPQT